MRDSLRVRLLLWYALILTTLVVLYGGTVSYRYRESLIRDVDVDLTGVAATVGASVETDVSGEIDINLPPELREARFADGSLRFYYAVWNAQGELVDRSDPRLSFARRPEPGAQVRDGYREVVLDTADGARVAVGRTLDDTDRDVRALALSVGATGLGVLLLSLAGGWFLVGRALAPIARISSVAGAMIGGDLAARIPVQETHSELEEVARALNEAFDRLQMAADRQRTFTADASHELRTPLATLRAAFDWILMKPRTAEEYHETIVKGQAAVMRMTNLVDSLLSLAREEHASAGRQRDTIDLAGLLADTVEMLRPFASAHGVTMTEQYAPTTTCGDPGRLTDAFANLVKNAIEYNHEGGQVDISCSASDGWAVVTVHDTGTGISADDLPRIFDRFYRADKARGRKVGGAGLGLAIAKKAIEGAQGTITCESEAGAGTAFTVRLPANASPQADRLRA